jgi:hypothetical protein
VPRSFRLENHRSFRGEAELSLLPSYETELPVVPVAAIYGANAAGKSSVLDGLRFMSRAVGEVLSPVGARGWRPPTPLQARPGVTGLSFDLRRRPPDRWGSLRLRVRCRQLRLIPAGNGNPPVIQQPPPDQLHLLNLLAIDPRRTRDGCTPPRCGRRASMPRDSRSTWWYPRAVGWGPSRFRNGSPRWCVPISTR